MPQVKLLDPSDPRRRLDRYELIGEIAAGGMATVFLARLEGAGGFQRFVAIKRLHPHLASEQEFVEMFLDEARLAAGIHHPHVVPILEVGTTEAGYYLVMEYIEGDTLSRIYARALSGGQPAPRPILARIALDALAGLHAAHELTDAQGRHVELVHRDCSPQNILVGVDGCSRITDFGVARATSRLASTRSDRLKGKLAYMAPEQTKGGALDRRADVFAMGIVLWEVLSGRRLFKAESEAATLSRIVLEPIPRLRDANPDAPAALDEVCARALARDLERRYQSAAEFAEALERAARESGEPAASPREVASYVQAVLGQDIAAQRESVRVWLQHESAGPTAHEGAPPPARPWGFGAEGGSTWGRVPEPHRPAAGATPERTESSAPPAPGRPARPAPPGDDGPEPTTFPVAPPDRPSANLAGVIPVELPPDRPPDDGDPAREASLTTAKLAFAPRTSELPSRLSLAPGRRRRAPIAGAAAAIALLAGGVAAWTALRPAPSGSDAAAGTAAAPVTAPVTAPVAAAASAPVAAAVAGSAPVTTPGTAPVAAAVSAPVTAAASAPVTAAASAPVATAAPVTASAIPASAPVTAPVTAPATTSRPGNRGKSPGAAQPADDLANPYR